MVSKLEVLDYVVLAQLVLSILFWATTKIIGKTLVVYISLIIFFCYWLIRLVFNPEFKDRISGN
jgi:high-affinity nickel permease